MATVDDELATSPSVGVLRRSALYPVVAFLVVGAVLFVWVWLSVRFLDRHPQYPVAPARFAGSGFLEGWFRFDGGWYRYIADNGYFFTDLDTQSPVAFFPGYPLGMRAVALVVRDTVLAAIVLTAVCGLGASVVFHDWTRRLLGDRTARTALLVLLLYPFAFYLFGAVYGDALFLVATIGAFWFFERDRPLLAGLAGAVATATRPLGLAVVVGLVVLTVARHGGLRSWRTLRARDAGVLLSLGGLVAWTTYLWTTFGDPLLFSKIQGADGWDQSDGPHTWFKVAFFDRLPHLPFWLSDSIAGSTTHNAHPWTESVYTLGLVLQAAALLAALALVPLVVRRLGWGYGAFVVTLLVIPLLGTKDFQGVGRYVLAAFPCFAVAGQLLAGRPRLRVGWFVVSGALLLLLSSGYARGYYVG